MKGDENQELRGARRRDLRSPGSTSGRAATAVVAALLVGALGAGAGYWFGAQRGQGHAAADAAPAERGGKKILYYRNPMGLPSTSPVPKKDPMGMDYIPVYEGEQDAGPGIQISSERVQKLGVRVAPVERRALDAVVRASGRIAVDERRLASVTPKFDGFIERLHVNTTGQTVARGAPLFDAFSPDLLAAQREYAIAVQGLARLKDADEPARAGMQRLADSALARLRLADVSDEEIGRLAASGEPRRTLTFRAPISGVVLERKAVQGMRFATGEPLFAIADLSRLWLIAEVAEQDLGRIRPGTHARVRLDAYPGQTFEGRVTFVLPTLQAATRSAQVRIELANADGRLKPEMFAQVDLLAGAAGGAQLVVPNSAVIDSGARQVAIVDLGAGRFEQREIETGGRGDEFTVIKRGLREGESVVVAANFLLDSEANLRAALAGLKGGSNASPEPVPVVHEAVGTLDEVDPASGVLLITHEPVKSLNWPTMTMEFVPAHSGLAAAVRPGQAIRFEFVERKPGEWVVTKMERRQ